MESYYDNGKLFEKFGVHHYSQFKVRNRTEKIMIEYIKAYLNHPINESIETIRNKFIEMSEITPKNFGSVKFSEIRCFGTIVGKNHWQEREFSMTVTGRNIPTLSISENVFKDANDEFNPVINLVFNPKPQ